MHDDISFESAKYIVERNNVFTVCQTDEELERCEDAKRWCSSRLYYDASYTIDHSNEALLRICGTVREARWVYYIPYSKDGDVYNYDRCERVTKRKYWFGPVISDTMSVRIREEVKYDIVTSQFKLVSKDYNVSNNK
jgi:hypothetical protein